MPDANPENVPISAYCCSQSEHSAGITIGPAPGVVSPSVCGGIHLRMLYKMSYICINKVK